MSDLDMAIRWADETRLRQRITRLNGITMGGRPKQLKCPGGRVYVVTAQRRVRASFVAAKILGPIEVTLAEGQKRSGYRVVAKKDSLVFHDPGKKWCSIKNWHAIGAIRYFDPANGSSVIVGEPSAHSAFESEDAPKKSVPKLTIRTIPYTCGIPKLPRNNPESQLVDAYVNWIGDPTKFEHDSLESTEVYTDLFDRSRWRLIEAKSKVDRFTLRTAHGQLLDYKRFYLRRPSLGVLLPERPKPSSIAYLLDYGIAVIWKVGRGFRDSHGGAWTKLRRVR